MVQFTLQCSDILDCVCDVMLLKYADGFHGVDQLVSQKVGFSGSIPAGGFNFIHGNNTESRKILYVGVGPLGDFRYEQIREFGAKSLHILGQGSGQNEIIASPIHGPGYGLDEGEALLSLIAGFTDAIESGNHPKDLKLIKIVENNRARANRLKKILLSSLQKAMNQHENSKIFDDKNILASISINANRQTHDELSSYGTGSENKTKIFVAMPFSDEFIDEYELAIKEATDRANLICERIDEQAYTGDILIQIRNRIKNSDGLIALLNGANPNVFLEVGFAWAHGKPTILMIKTGEKLPFDVQSQKCIIYRNVTELKKKLSEEIGKLTSDGTFRSSARR